MAAYQNQKEHNAYVIPVSMKGWTPEEIAWDAVMQIDTIMDQIAAEWGMTLKNEHAENS